MIKSQPSEYAEDVCKPSLITVGLVLRPYQILGCPPGKYTVQRSTALLTAIEVKCDVPGRGLWKCYGGRRSEANNKTPLGERNKSETMKQ